MVDPYAVDPAKHFIVHGPVVTAFPGDDLALTTERLLDLNRSELLGRRMEKLEALRRHREVIARTLDPALVALLERDFDAELGDEREYAATARSFARVVRAR